MTAAGYAAPRTIDEAVSLLKEKNARVLAGGHTLLVEPSRSRLADARLVDLRRIPGLAGIDADAGGGVRIGAMATLSAIAASEAVKKSWPTLAEVAAATGDAQLRNRATLGGSLAGGSPDADLPALALVLDAAVQVTGPNGTRTVNADDFFSGGHAAARDIITAVTVPAPAPRSGLAYQVQRHPATLAPLCGVAAAITVGADGTVSAARVAVTGAAERVARLPGVEKSLIGKAAGEAAVALAAQASGEGLTFRGDLYGSADYRRHLTRVLAGRALKQALARAAERAAV